MLDFGISKIRGSHTVLTQDAALLGTPQYMAPEQATGRNDEIDARTDVFALGAMTFEMLAGKPPFTGDTLAAVIHAIVYTPTPPLASAKDVPPAIVAAVERAMEKNRDARFPDVNSFVKAVTSRSLPPVPCSTSSPIEEYRTVKSTVERLSPTRVRINVEVPFDELKPDFDRAYKKIAQQVRVPGFRPGKVPARIIEARLGRGVVLEEVVNGAIPAKYSEAVTAAEERHRRSAARTSRSPRSPTASSSRSPPRSTSARRSTLPELDVARGRGRRRRGRPTPTSTEQLDNLRARFGTLTGVERAGRQRRLRAASTCPPPSTASPSRRPRPAGSPTRSARAA